MSVVQFNNVYKQFAGEYLLKDVNFTIEDKDKIGLVGLNGAGKSTLIKMLLGVERIDPDEQNNIGNINMSNLTKIGYLSQNHNFCIVGDFNISFCDNYYFTNWGRNELNRSFAETEIINLTQSKTETIDHIAISKKFCKDSKVEVTEWNCGKELSDHKGISVKLH